MRLWYPHYPGDYLRDTMHLTCEQDGMYRRLLDHYYMTCQPIPYDRFKIAKILRVSPQKVAKNLQVLLKFFEVGEQENAKFLYHYRVEKEIDKALNLNEKLSTAGRAGGLAQARNRNQAKAQASPQPQPHSNNKPSSRVDQTGYGGTKSKKTSKKAPAKNYCEKILEQYHKILPELIPISKITQKLEKDLLAIHNDADIGCHEIRHWQNFFKRIKKSTWLTGRKPGVKARYSLRKLIEPETYAKIYEGNYDD